MRRIAVSVIMCTRNRGDRLAAALDSIDQIKFDGEWEFILIDNGSTDSTQEAAKAFASRTRIKNFRCVTEPGAGLSRARNRGVRESRGALIAFTDDDCYAEPDWLRELTFAFQFEQIGFCGGQILLFDPADAPITISWSKTPHTYPPNGFVHAGDIQGANMAFRREALERIGLFDRRFRRRGRLCRRGSGRPVGREPQWLAWALLAKGHRPSPPWAQSSRHRQPDARLYVRAGRPGGKDALARPAYKDRDAGAGLHADTASPQPASLASQGVLGDAGLHCLYASRNHRRKTPPWRNGTEQFGSRFGKDAGRAFRHR